MDLWWNIESDDEWLDSPPQVYLVTISKFPTAAGFPIDMEACKINSLLDRETKVSCITYDCYKEFTLNTKNQYKGQS